MHCSKINSKIWFTCQVFVLINPNFISSTQFYYYNSNPQSPALILTTPFYYGYKRNIFNTFCGLRTLFLFIMNYYNFKNYIIRITLAKTSNVSEYLHELHVFFSNYRCSIYNTLLWKFEGTKKRLVTIYSDIFRYQISPELFSKLSA